MKTTLLIFALLLFSISIYVFINNRDHDKITELFTTSMILGIGASLLSMTFTLKKEKKETKFISSATVLRQHHNVNIQEQDLYLTLTTNRNFPSIPYSRNLLNVKQFYYQEHPEIFKKYNNDLSDELYFEILTYSILIDLFNQFSQTWTSKVEFIKTPTGVERRSGNSIKKKSKETDWDNAAKLTDLEIFKEFKPESLLFPRNAKLHTPLHSTLSIDTIPLGATIEIKDKIGIFKIDVLKLGSSSDCGEIGTLLDIPRLDRPNYCTYNYEIKFTSEINKWKSGHPNAKLHRDYYTTILNLLVENYSYDKYLKETKEWHLLYSKE